MRRCKVAFFELLAAATRAKVVPPHLRVQILTGCLTLPNGESGAEVLLRLPPVALRATRNVGRQVKLTENALPVEVAVGSPRSLLDRSAIVVTSACAKEFTLGQEIGRR
jgi:hypothetical protein